MNAGDIKRRLGSMILFLAGVSSMCIATNIMATPNSKSEVMKLVVETAKEEKLAPSLALAVARVGSSFSFLATGSGGERGVMQLHPNGVEKQWDITPEQLWDAEINIKHGVKYLKKLTETYPDRTDLALSHYYGLHINSSKQLTHVLPATRNFVRRVLHWQKKYQTQAQIWTELPVPAIKYEKLQNGANCDCYNLPNSNKEWPVDDFHGDIEERRAQARSILDDFGDDPL